MKQELVPALMDLDARIAVKARAGSSSLSLEVRAGWQGGEKASRSWRLGKESWDRD